MSGSGPLEAVSLRDPDSSAASCLSVSSLTRSRFLPLAISSSLFGVPTRTSTGRDTPSGDTVSVPSVSLANCAAILEAVNVARGVLFTFALEAQRTLSLTSCNRALAKEDSCRDNSWVGAKTNALGFTARCWDGITGEVDSEQASSDFLRW